MYKWSGKTDFAGKVIWWNGTNLKMQNIEDHDLYEFEHEVGTIIEYNPPQLIKKLCLIKEEKDIEEGSGGKVKSESIVKDDETLKLNGDVTYVVKFQKMRC